MIVKTEIEPIDFEGWCGAEETIRMVRQYDLEDEFNSFCEMYFEGEVDETEFNDFLRFEDDYIFENIGLYLAMDEDEEDEEEEDEEEE